MAFILIWLQYAPVRLLCPPLCHEKSKCTVNTEASKNRVKPMLVNPSITQTHEYFRRVWADVGKELAVRRRIACARTAANSCWREWRALWTTGFTALFYVFVSAPRATGQLQRGRAIQQNRLWGCSVNIFLLIPFFQAFMSSNRVRRRGPNAADERRVICLI